MDFFKKAQQSMGGSAGESDLLKQAEGFMGSQSSGGKTAAPAASTEKPAAPDAAAPTAPGSDAGLYGSANTLFQGLQGKLSGKPSDIDNQELAGAAANVLEAAEKSGFAKDSQYGEYFDKAEGYLQNYSNPKSATPAAAPVAEKAPAAEAPPAK